jgi:hypothetical protein
MPSPQRLRIAAVPYPATMEERRKITVVVSSDLLDKAQNAAHAGITETVRKGLELLAASDLYDRLLKMRGRVSTPSICPDCAKIVVAPDSSIRRSLVSFF